MQIRIELQSGSCVLFVDGSLDSLTGSSFYKINIKRYVSSVVPPAVYFKSGLSYIALKKIIAAFNSHSLINGYELLVSPEIVEYISVRELHLESRSKLGIELKNQEEKLTAHYHEFEETVNKCLERKLREKQMWDSFFMTTMKKSCNFSVPGSGKTSAVYGMYAFLKDKGLASRIVVVCPKNAFGPWVDEFSSCFGAKQELCLFNVHDPSISTAAKKKAAIKYEAGSANLLLFNYECIKSLEREISSLIDDRTILVFDEVHKVKRIDGEYAKAAISIAKEATYVVAMTGTPIPNSYQDIYNLLHILFFEEYEDFFGFTPAGLKNPTGTEREIINKKLQPFFCRTTKQQLLVPPANSDSMLPLKASEDETAIFRTLLKKHKKNKLLLMLRILQLESDPQLLLSAINLADYQYVLEEDVPVDEIDYADYTDDMLERINRCGTTTKTQQCINLINGLVLQKKPIVVWCIYVKTIQNLARLLKQEGVNAKCVFGEIPLEDRQTILQEFKSGAFDVLITNPNTLAESISLHTICHDAIYFEYSFNLVHLLQSKDRIHRLGLPEGQYTQFYFLETMYSVESGYYSMDEQIYNRLREKESIMLKAIEAETLEQMPTTEEELDMIFSPLNL